MVIWRGTIEPDHRGVDELQRRQQCRAEVRADNPAALSVGVAAAMTSWTQTLPSIGSACIVRSQGYTKAPLATGTCGNLGSQTSRRSHLRMLVNEVECDRQNVPLAKLDRHCDGEQSPRRLIFA